MQITRATDYAIRLLAHLAAGDAETTSAVLADELDIPLNHLAKLVQTLARQGYLFTRKGRGGGLKLAIDPRKIKLARIIEVVEGPIIVNECVLNNKNCKFSGKCKVRRCLKDVRGRIHEMLMATSIFDVALQYN